MTYPPKQFGSVVKYITIINIGIYLSERPYRRRKISESSFHKRSEKKWLIKLNRKFQSIHWFLHLSNRLYLSINVVHSISFQTFFVQAFKIVIDSWKFSMLLRYILWDDWPIFMISGSNEQLQQQLEYTLLKPDCHN